MQPIKQMSRALSLTACCCLLWGMAGSAGAQVPSVDGPAPSSERTPPAPANSSAIMNGAASRPQTAAPSPDNSAAQRQIGESSPLELSPLLNPDLPNPKTPLLPNASPEEPPLSAPVNPPIGP